MTDSPFVPAVGAVPEAIAWWARETPHALAVLPLADGAATVSFGELEARVQARTAQLEAAGIAHGNRVAFRAGGKAEAIVACLAVMRAGVALPLPPAVTGADLTAMPRQFRPSGVLIGPDDVALVLAAEQARVPQLEDSRHGSERVATTRAMGRGLSPRQPAADDLALILQSSGATGRPRGVPRTHRNLLTGAAAFEAWIGREALERGLVTTPLAFGLGVNAAFPVARGRYCRHGLVRRSGQEGRSRIRRAAA